MSALTIEPLDVDSFSTALTQQPDPWVIYFYAPWCQPCKTMKPVFKQAMQLLNTSKLNIGEVNVATSPTIAQSYGIGSVPTIVLFQKQAPIAVIPGEMPSSQLAQTIKNKLATL